MAKDFDLVIKCKVKDSFSGLCFLKTEHNNENNARKIKAKNPLVHR